MISRRNIRVKVMQTLYSLDSVSGDMKPGEPQSILTKKIEQSSQLFTYLIYFITEVARYSETDARQKASKHLPTEAELFINWDDDGEMMQTLVLNYLNRPGQNSFHDILSKEKWEFARNLLTTVQEKEAYTLELIKPKLNNWDAERIAALDLIILRMGVCEFLYFETIPTKVTINEYIDLAKDYSTVQSGQFVNGLLDSIHKELMTENKIDKKSFKNSTL